MINIYDNLKGFLSEIKVSYINIKCDMECSEDPNNELIYSELESRKVLYNGKPQCTFIKDLNTILSKTEEILKESVDLNDSENINLVEEIINGLIEHIETKTAFIIQSKEQDYKVRNSFVSEIIDKLNIHKNSLIKTSPDHSNEQNFRQIKNSPLIWNKNHIDLLELVTALYEANAFKNLENNLTQKEAIELFSDFFNIKIKNPSSSLSHGADRMQDAPFITILKKSFIDYVNKLAMKQEERYKGRTRF